MYIGVTNDLIRRVYEHKNNLVEGFTNKYRVHRLVYWEQSENVDSALQREKQLKKWNRQWKLALIEERNANWQDLYEQLRRPMDSQLTLDPRLQTSGMTERKKRE